MIIILSADTGHGKGRRQDGGNVVAHFPEKEGL